MTDNSEKTINTLNYLLKTIKKRFKKKDNEFYKIMVFIDDYNELVDTDKRINDLVIKILEHGSEVGVHLILGMQRPNGKVFNDKLKSLISCRIVLTTTLKEDSNEIIGTEDAINLEGCGDILFKEAEDSCVKHLKGLFIGDNEVKEILKRSEDFRKAMMKAIYEFIHD